MQGAKGGVLAPHIRRPVYVGRGCAYLNSGLGSRLPGARYSLILSRLLSQDNR
jgi:hypothetical protein